MSSEYLEGYFRGKSQAYALAAEEIERKDFDALNTINDLKDLSRQNALFADGQQAMNEKEATR